MDKFRVSLELIYNYTTSFSFEQYPSVIMKTPRRLLTFMILLSMFRGVLAGIFNSFVSYRHGTNGPSINSERYDYEIEPDAPLSVDEAFAFTTAKHDEISVVHCYSMRKGLTGSVKSASIIWSTLSFEATNDLQIGSAKNVKSISLPIEAQISQFIVRESDLTVFLMASTGHNDLIIHMIPFQAQDKDNLGVSTFKLSISQNLGVFLNTVKGLLHIPAVTAAEKLVFYSEEFVGEVIFTEKAKPLVKVAYVQELRDNSGKFKVLQMNKSVQTDKLFCLLQESFDGKMSLRIDSILTDSLRGSASNIVRVNTNASAAYLNAVFSPIAEDGNTHYFATFAFQSMPSAKYFITMSSAQLNEKEHSWSNDMSTEFIVPVENLLPSGEVIRALSIMPTGHQTINGKRELKFTVLFFSKSHLLRADIIAISQTNVAGFILSQATFHHSVPLQINSALTKVAYGHQGSIMNKKWPAFYVVAACTDPLRQGDNGKMLVQDGLILSEYYMLRIAGKQLMQQKSKMETIDLWSINGKVNQNIRHKSSGLLPHESVSRLIVKKSMQPQLQLELVSDETENSLFGKEYVDAVTECNMPIENYAKLSTKGLTSNSIIAYLDKDQSTSQNILLNSKLISRYQNGLTLNNNIKSLYLGMATQRCNASSDEAAFCAAMVTQCFTIDVSMFECDTKGHPTDVPFIVPDDLVIENEGFVGQAFYAPVSTNGSKYFLSSAVITRVDGKIGKDFDSPSTTRIAVFDNGESVRFYVPPRREITIVQGDSKEISYSKLVDPEGEEVYIKVALRKATTFAHFDYDELKLIIDGRLTVPGVYPISYKFGEIIDGIMMPPTTYEVTLNVTAEPLPLPELETIREGAPKGRIASFLMNGKLKLTFDDQLTYQEDAEASMIGFERRSVPLRPIYKDLVDFIELTIVPGGWSESELLQFSYQVTSVDSAEVNFKITFDNPFEISQKADPEKIIVVLNLYDVKDVNELRFTNDRVVFEAFVPRQIANEAEAAAIEESGANLEAASTGMMAGNFFISLLMAASLNQLWSMIGGLQLTVHLPLFYVMFPANANFLLTFLIDVATFDMLPPEATDWLLKFPEKPSYNLAFQSCRYSSMYAVENLGTCYMLINLYLLQVIICLICGCLRNCCSCANSTYLKYKKALFWGSLIRLLFEGYLELCLSIFVSLTDMDWPEDDLSVRYNNWFSIIMSVLLFGMPVFIATFYFVNTDNMEDEKFKSKFGDIYEGLVLSSNPDKRRITLFYPFWFVTRRLIFALVCILLQDDFFWQFHTSMVSCLINLGYMLKYQPFEEVKIFRLEVMNELTNIFLLFHLLMFTEWVGDPEVRYSIGWSFIGFTIANMLVHFSLMIIGMVCSVKDKIENRFCPKPPQDEVEEQEEIAKPVLTPIDEDDAESNFSSEKNAVHETGRAQLARAGIGQDKGPASDQKSFESDWHSSHLGSPEDGYKLDRIRWRDLGHKFNTNGGTSKKAAFDDIFSEPEQGVPLKTQNAAAAQAENLIRINFNQDNQLIISRALSQGYINDKNYEVEEQADEEQIQLEPMADGRKTQIQSSQKIKLENQLVEPDSTSYVTDEQDTRRELIMLKNALDSAKYDDDHNHEENKEEGASESESESESYYSSSEDEEESQIDYQQ